MEKVEDNQEVEKITNFKNDIFFKYLLSSNDEDSIYLLKLIIENVTKIKCKEVYIGNPFLIPEHNDGKVMMADIMVKTDTGITINIEMQNSKYSFSHRKRFLGYGYKMAVDEYEKGKDYDEIENIYQIIFIDDVAEKVEKLKARYLYREDNYVRYEGDIVRMVYVQMPCINEIVKEKGIENLSSFEKVVYILENGLDNDILRVKDKAVEIMERKNNMFNENKLLRTLAFNQDMKIAIDKKENIEEGRIAGRKEGREEGLQIGEKRGELKGKLNNQREMTQYAFKEKYPTEDVNLLENLTLEQYEEIFKMLIKDASITDIKKKLKMGMA